MLLCLEALQRSLRAIDEIARTGDDEFSVVLHATDAKQANAWADRFDVMLEEVATGHPAAEITCSLGVADTQETPTLVEAAARARRRMEVVQTVRKLRRLRESGGAPDASRAAPAALAARPRRPLAAHAPPLPHRSAASPSVFGCLNPISPRSPRMNRIFRRRPSPAMGVALIALFISLSGVSYGVATGFIDSREIKNNTIRGKDIRNGTIRTEDLRNNEVRGFDIRNSTIRSVGRRAEHAHRRRHRRVEARQSPGRHRRRQSRHGRQSRPPPTTALSPVAFARVSSTGDVIEANSRGVADANVTREKTASFCFRGLGFAFKSAQVTIDYGAADSTGTNEIAQVALGNPKGDCAATARSSRS